jgi:hypothetical protein
MNKTNLAIIAGIILVLIAIKAYACSTETIIIDGRIINCTTCGSVTNCY